MADYSTALDFLGHGDALRERVTRDGTSVGTVVADADLPSPVAHKAHWLAGAYDNAARRSLGRGLLSELTPMHLEVVATRSPDAREGLLRRAADSGLTARQLRELARAEGDAGGADAGGTIEALARSARAMEQYSRFDDRALRTLLQGPNGDEIRRVATIGRALADRLTTVS